jgi:hypothetical protein
VAELADRAAVPGANLSPDSTAPGVVKREKVDVVEVEYFSSQAPSLLAQFPRISALLASLTVSAGATGKGGMVGLVRG